MQPVMELEQVHKVYQAGEVAVAAVCGVSVTIKHGEFVAIMGASGSGKSTLMNVLGCLDRPTNGVYRLDSIDVSELDRDQRAELRNRKLGFVFQGFNLLSRTTALENVELPMFCRRPHAPAPEVRARAEQCLARVGLGDRVNHFPNQLSGGQQQRVAIARALVNEPEVVLADEPTGNLDSRTSVEIMCLFQELNDSGVTIVVVTHESDIARYCKRNLTMRDGQLTRDEPVARRLVARDEWRKRLAQESAEGLTG